MSFDRLLEAIAEKQAPVVVGLDPALSYIPEFIRKEVYARLGETLEAAAEAVWIYNRGLIDALYDVIPAVKPQYAYYEQFGWQGMRTLAQTIGYAKSKGLFVIGDGKRNDIGSTMEAYANAHLGTIQVGTQVHTAFDVDALTVNAYLGTDGVEPVLKACAARDKGIFVLCKTSNPSAGELQDVPATDGRPVYAVLGDLCERWGSGQIGRYGYSAVGAVVGATYPQQLEELRARMKATVFLVPGYGAQGGKASDIALAFDENGCGAIVNSSRAVLCAWQKSGGPEEDYAAAARAEAQRMIAEIRSFIPKITLRI